ncbi:MAG: DUF3109 family protein [Bacteroidota bacterium]|jgi:hypothetical protein
MQIDPSIISTRFSCDLAACKGSCCTFPGGSGPPISEDEMPILERAWVAVRALLPAQHRQEGERLGLFVRDGEDMTIRCYNYRACLFVMYEKDIAICSIQKLHQAGQFDWPKPVSCHLFPVRVRGKRRDQIRFEEFSECAPALEAGERDDIPLVDFLEIPLKRAFGDTVFVELKALSDRKHRNGGEGG